MERESIVEGIFYPEDREKLSETVKGYILSPALSSQSADIIGLIVPHAGYSYCGQHTGKAFALTAEKKVETVILLGPVHREPEEGLFLTESKHFITPLGSVEVDQDFNEELLGISTKFLLNDIPHLEEHCLEVQLPFIQVLFPGASIVPILMGTPSVTAIEALSGALEVIVPGKTANVLIVISANASSFAENKTADDSAKLYISCVEKGDSEALIRGIGDRSITSCGAGCTAAVLQLKGIALRGRLVSEGSSRSESKGDKHNIHYASFELTGVDSNG